MLLVLVLLAVVVIVPAVLVQDAAPMASLAAGPCVAPDLSARTPIPAKEAKYAEIRDAELDHRMGKLSDEDWRAQDRALRAEAMDILRQLDAL